MTATRDVYSVWWLCSLLLLFFFFFLFFWNNFYNHMYVFSTEDSREVVIGSLIMYLLIYSESITADTRVLSKECVCHWELKVQRIS